MTGFEEAANLEEDIFVRAFEMFPRTFKTQPTHLLRRFNDHSSLDFLILSCNQWYDAVIY